MMLKETGYNGQNIISTDTHNIYDFNQNNEIDGSKPAKKKGKAKVIHYQDRQAGRQAGRQAHHYKTTYHNILHNECNA